MFSLKCVLRRVSPWLFWGLVLVYVPLCLLFVSMKWAVLPWANEYRPQLQLWASEALGQPVEFDRVDAQWLGLRPQVVFQNVRVLDSAGDVGFSSQKVRLDWSLWGLLALSPHASNVEVLAPVVHVNRNAAGLWVVAGHELQPSGRSYNAGLDWLLKQQRVLVKQAQVIWSDELGVLPSGRAEAGELLLRNGFGRHRFALRVRSDVLGSEALDVRADFRTPLLSLHPSVWQAWRGDVFAQASVENAQMLDALMKRFGVDADVLRPQGRLWAEFESAVVRHALLAFQVNRFELKHVATNHAEPKGLAPLVVSGLWGVLDARGWLLSDEGGWLPDGLMVRQLTGVLGRGQAFGPASFGFSKAEHEGGQPRWRAAFQNLDLSKSKGFLEGVLPYVGQDALLETLRAWELSGVLKTAEVSWVSHPEFDVQVDLAFDGLTVLRGEPLGAGGVQWSGVQGLSGRVQGNNQAGVWQLNGTQVGVLLPKHFASSQIVFEDLRGSGAWAHLWSDQGVPRVVLNRLDVRNADAEGGVAGSVALPVEGGAVLDLKGRVLRADVSKVPAYLPLILGEKVRDWLGQALVGGLVQHGAFEIQGLLSDFPFKDKRHPGRFRGDLPFEHARLHYGDGWPDVTQAKGKVVFDGAALRVQADAAEIYGVAVKHGSADIAVLGPEPSPLRISGQAEGPLSRMLGFVNESPVGDWLHQALLLAEGEGTAKVDLQLQVPLLDLKKTEVKGVLGLNDNSARLMPSMPKASGLKGQVRFSNRGVFIDHLTGEALGGVLSVKGETSEQGVIRIQSQGEASAAGLAEFLNPLMAPYLQGKAPYAVDVTSQAGQLEVVVNSSLQGMGLLLPAPFSKSQDAVFPVHLVHRMVPNAGMRVALDLGGDVAQLRAIVSDRRAAAGGVESLQFSVGGPLPVPEPGVLGEVSVPVLDADAWRAVYEQISGRGGVLSAVVPSGLLGDLLVVKPEAKMLPTRVNVKTGRLSVGSKQFDGVALSARTIEKRWQFDVKAKGVDGYFSWVQDALRPEGAVLARFKTLSIPKTLDAGLKEWVEEPASSIPALDVQVDDFSMNQLKLGALTLKAVNQGVDERSKIGARAREWYLDVFKIENPDFTTTAKGSWRYTPGLVQQSTDIELSQVIHNTGGFLSRLGMKDVFRGGQSRLEGRVHWNDAPMNIDYASLGGQLKLSSKKGQFLKADPGAAKLLGVLSMQGLARRLSLDFKDLFSQGLAYDEVEADVLLNKGIASTPNFKMKAPSVTLLMDGSLDIKAETQNLNVLVLPDLSPTGGSLVYSVVAANPAVGLVSLIADFILKDPLSKVFSIQYKVTGPWGAPVLERRNQNVDLQEGALGGE